MTVKQEREKTLVWLVLCRALESSDLELVMTAMWVVANAVAGSSRVLISDFAYNTNVIKVIHSVIETTTDSEMLKSCGLILD